MPDSSPNCWLVIANSLFIVNAANPMLILSTKLITKRTKTNGMMCVRSLRIVVASIVLGAGAGLALTPHPQTRSAEEYTPRDVNERYKQPARSFAASNRALESSRAHAQHYDRR